MNRVRRGLSIVLAMGALGGILMADEPKPGSRPTRQEIVRQLNLSDDVTPQALSIAIELHLVRQLMELYRIQHADMGPLMANMGAWQGLTGKSKSDGTPSNAYGDMGPYLRSLPLNPFTNFTRVVPAGHADAGAGWTYDERTWKIRAVVPQVNLAAMKDLPTDDYEVLSPKGLILATTLQSVNNQLLDYKMTRGHFPTLLEMNDWNALLTMGPESKLSKILPMVAKRLTAPPLNVITKSTRLVASGQPASDAGWTYNEKTGEVRVVMLPSELKHANELSAKDYEMVAATATAEPTSK